MIQTTLVLAFTGLAAAEGTAIGFNRHRAPPSGLLPFAGLNSHRINMGLQDSCYSFQEECDTLYCIPTGTECCGDGNGAYCDIGYYCTPEACCLDGEECSGPPTDCLDGRELCDGYCIPEGSDCCGGGYYCDPGTTCNSDGTCDGGSSSDDTSDDDTSIDECDLSTTDCDGYCIPLTAVCCGDGYYCDFGETCTGDGYCESGLFDDDDDDTPVDDDDETDAPVDDATETSASESPEETATNIFETDTETSTTEEPTTSETEESTSTTSSEDADSTALTNGGPDDTAGGDDNTDAASLMAPSLLLALVAALGLAL